ncbi:PREDICTED: transportin-3-like [Amphimedon queenslandica]|uniref:Uncharacterized protein n=1 Tax=Amphimedon queenslandica TaxID=400682 RepID=A0A1X7UEC9_AMPQE|nr:PREDICTED: transportin-3-like [Amphimedon queenslandica]|eukprot:XP_019854788.1 PREDICTED: transportin-3-like [Amphimedon queenslandica]
MERPQVETVLQTLYTLYKASPNDLSRQAAANEWLTQLQKSVYAWDISNQLLSLDTDVDYGYFAAQTMQTKIRHSFNELSVDMHIPLRDSLMNHLTNHSKTSSPIIKQLVLALADLALQMNGWGSVVQDCINRFGGDFITVPVLLEILLVLPEEVGNRKLRLGENTRLKWKEVLGSECPVVFQLLESCIGCWPNEETILIKVYSCLSSWIVLKSFPVDNLTNSSLIVSLFHTLHLTKVTLKLYESATDCICSALYVCDDAAMSGYAPLALVLKNHVHQLLPVFTAAIETEDSNRANCLARIFTEMAESLLFSIVHYPDTPLGDIKTFELLLHCAEHYEFEVVEMTFSVWYRLSELLGRSRETEFDERFKPYVLKFITYLVKHCQLNDDLGPTELPDDKDDFMDFRLTVAEVLRDSVFIIGSVNCFERLYSVFRTPGQSWIVLESCLYLMHSVASSIPKDESNVLPIAVPVLVSIPPDTHYAIRCTTLKLIGELSHWIGAHPHTMNEILRFIQDGFSIPVLSSYSAAAVQSICHKCRGQLAHLFESLVVIIQTADNIGMSNTAVVGLITASVEVLTGVSSDKMSSCLHALCLGSAQRLTQIMQGNIPVQAHSVSDPALWMDRIAAVFRTCEYEPKINETHPGLYPANEVCPLIYSTIEYYKRDSRIVERACRCIRFILRCLKAQAGPLLTPLVTMSISVYQECNHSCFLYLGSIIADEFGSDPSSQPGLMTMVESFLSVSLILLSGPGGLVNHPDTVDDMFRLCARMVQRCPVVFLTSPVSGTALECAKAASLHIHREAFSSVMKFFKDLIHAPFDINLTEEEQVTVTTVVNHILTENGQTLTNSLVEGFVTLQTYMLAESTPVLYELLTNYKDVTMNWLSNAINHVQFNRKDKMTDSQKMTFLQSVQQADSQDTLEDVAREFVRLFR